MLHTLKLLSYAIIIKMISHPHLNFHLDQPYFLGNTIIPVTSKFQKVQSELNNLDEFSFINAHQFLFFFSSFGQFISVGQSKKQDLYVKWIRPVTL